MPCRQGESMQCLRCKSENDDAAKFCASCGSPLYKAAAPVVCHICAHANKPDANFCVACGAHLQRQFVTPPATAPSAANAADAHRASEVPRAHPHREPAAFAETRPNPPDTKADRPSASPNARTAAGTAPAHQDAFDRATIRPPRIPSFELKAGLAVLILFLGGGLLWWSNENNSHLAELALTAATPSTIQAGSDTSSRVSASPESTQRSSYTANAEPAPGSTLAQSAALAGTAAEAPVKAKTPKHKTARRRHAEDDRQLASAAPEAVPEPEPQVATQAPEKRKPNVRELVASCKRMSLFEGERCLWRLCDGKWGKDGCPSYN